MIFEVRSKERVIVAGSLNEAICPNTINEMLKRGEFNTMVIKLSDRLLFKVQIRAGYEKPKRSFKKNEVAFDPPGQWLTVFLRDAEEQRGLNPIGTAETIDLDAARSGTPVKLFIRYSAKAPNLG